MKSLQLRLAIALLISLLCAVSLLGWQTKRLIRQLAENTVVEHLEHDAEAIYSAVYADSPTTIALTHSDIEPVYSRLYSGHYYWVASRGQIIKSPSFGDNRLTLPTVVSGTRQWLYLAGPQHQPLLGMAFGYRKDGRAMTVAIAEDLSPTLVLIAEFEKRFSVIAAVFLLVLMLIQIAILRKGFRPLARLQKQMKALERGERSQIDTDVPQEISALVGEFNHLLTVLDQRMLRMRNSLADLAHALKTPLTVLQQLSREDAMRKYPEFGEILNTQTAHMLRLMERVLKRARLAGSGPAVAKFDIHQEIPALIQVMKNIYREKNLAIRFSAPPPYMLPIDREDMLELAGNLLDNACKWAKLSVDIKVECNESVHLIIEDDGPGVESSEIEKLMQRGSRLDESVNGHGLGLSIAKLIVEQYGGRLVLGRSNHLGGFYAEAIIHMSNLG
ncbi:MULTISPECIES: ATP-binding protein [Methylomicrobium]|uniref:histidine kinase n=1 Tax=Methylomicrobium album BG8 TaxID=686340 RepID=H8GI30_METAL|nr:MULTISPECIES: ATP-binding protein [Methylomicrobium]EIC30174.1 signal transduction histidine kinase [Methylomicrobium album BG8]